MALALPLLAQQTDESRRLHRLFEQEWERTLRESPTFASFLGDKRYNREWGDSSMAAIERSQQQDRRVLEQLDAIDVGELSETDRLNYRLFRKQYEYAVAEQPYRWFLLPLNQRGGIQTENEVADSLSFDTAQDYEDWIARMEGFPAYAEQTIALMRQGIEEKRVHARIVMERVPAQIDKQIVERPTDSPFFDPFERFPGSIDAEERERLEQRALQAISDHIVPTFRRFKRFFMDEYLPATYERVGVWQFPSGKAMYAARSRRFTTTELTPEQIHQIGLDEVKRIRAEMEAIVEQVGFDGSFDEFLGFLRSDPRFYYGTAEELLEGYRAVAKRIDPTLPKLFGKLPRIPYGVEPIPDNIAPDTTTAYYRPPSADGRRAGTYFVNLYKPEVRPKFEMEALSIHEAVPGHHLQIALATELGAVPQFRKFSRYTAFTEGWGLYAESLGEELGFYKDPYSKFGQLTYEMWRAVRLVVDTGMHQLGWTRQQAIDFFTANAPKTEQDIVNEIDRYIAWPGQALAYKIGELKIKELRARAERRMGEAFDIREFHDVVLSAGGISLDLLEERVEAWLAAKADERP